MNPRRFFQVCADMLARPAQAIPAEARRQEGVRDLKDGLVTLAYVSVLLSLASLLIGWIVFLTFGALGWKPPFWMESVALNWVRGGLSPLAAALNLVVMYAALVAGVAAACVAVDFLQVKLFGNQGGRWRQLFNVQTQATAPFQLFGIVWLIGWLISWIGSVINSFRSLSAVYGEKNLLRNFVVLLLGGLAAAIPAIAVYFVLSLPVSAVKRIDPFQGPITALYRRLYGVEKESPLAMDLEALEEFDQQMKARWLQRLQAEMEKER